MSKTFDLVIVALSVVTGSAEAMTTRSHSLSYKHFSTCSSGLVKAMCVCRATNGPRRQGALPGIIATRTTAPARNNRSLSVAALG
jgi:hypothetical protein